MAFVCTFIDYTSKRVATTPLQYSFYGLFYEKQYTGLNWMSLVGEKFLQSFLAGWMYVTLLVNVHYITSGGTLINPYFISEIYLTNNKFEHFIPLASVNYQMHV